MEGLVFIPASVWLVQGVLVQDNDSLAKSLWLKDSWGIKFEQGLGESYMELNC